MDELKIEPEEVAGELAAFIRQGVDDLRRDGVIVGLSGGLTPRSWQRWPFVP